MPHDVEWLKVDLDARNAELRRIEDAIHNQAQYTIAVIAAAAFLLASNLFQELAAWRGPTALLISLVFAALAYRIIWQVRYLVITADYIKSDLLPRLGEYYGTDPRLLYGWEHRFTGSFIRLVAPFSAVGEALLYAVPFFGFAVYGFVESVGEAFESAWCGFAASVLALCCLLLAILGIVAIIRVAGGRFLSRKSAK